MNVDFHKKSLGDLIFHQKGFAFKSKDYQSKGCPVVRVSDFTENSVSTSDLKFVDSSIASQNSSVQLREGDIVIATVGSWPNNPASIVGRTISVPKELDGALLNQNSVLLRVRKGCLVDQEYLFYALKSSRFSEYLISTAQGSANQASITLKDIFNYEVEWPLEKKRESIVKVLGSIRRKIELNHQINQTLESISQALFKSWFVDFDPVKAKIAVLEAGGSDEEALLAAMQVISSKNAEELVVFEVKKPEEYAELRATAELFPAAMVEGELEEIPEGWEVGALADVADLNKNSWTKRSLPVEIEYVDLANTKNGIIESTTPYLSDEAPSRARRKLLDGDTIVGTVRPGNRSFAFIKKPSDILTGSTGFAVLSPKKRTYAEFIYIAATSDEAISRLAHLADGGAYPAVRSNVVSGLVTVIPEEAVLDRFHSLVSPFFERSERINIESLTLIKIRDTLLPNLLSGELKIARRHDCLTIKGENNHEYYTSKN